MSDYSGSGNEDTPQFPFRDYEESNSGIFKYLEVEFLLPSEVASNEDITQNFISDRFINEQKLRPEYNIRDQSSWSGILDEAVQPFPFSGNSVVDEAINEIAETETTAESLINVTWNPSLETFAMNTINTMKTSSLRPPKLLAISRTNVSLEYTRICGLPGFCKSSAYDTCFNTSLSNCDDCSTTGSIFFILFVVCLGLAILIGNSVILAVGWKHQKAGKASKMDACRCSLAIADLLTGFQLLCVVVYNYSWSIDLSVFELDREQLALRSTTTVLLGAMFFCLGYTSSVNHLLYMGLQRLYAIWRPINYKNQSKTNLQLGLAIVWIFSLVSATMIAWFPTHITSSYMASVFLYMPTIKTITENQNLTPLIILFSLTYILPYVLVTITIMISGVLVIRIHKEQIERLNAQSQAKARIKQRKTSVLLTVAIMQLGFTISLIPLAVVLILFYSEILTCLTLPIPYTISNLLSMANSLFNVIIYSLRDSAFRKEVKSVFLPKSPFGNTFRSVSTTTDTNKTSETLNQATSKVEKSSEETHSLV